MQKISSPETYILDKIATNKKLPIKGIHKSTINGQSIYVEEIARPSQSIEYIMQAMKYYIRELDPTT